MMVICVLDAKLVNRAKPRTGFGQIPDDVKQQRMIHFVKSE
jgi:hypothetical protein